MSTPAPRILLVDDQKDIVRLLHSSLQTIGQRLDIADAPSGEEALLEASRGKIDLLVADYRLPGMSGVELMRKVKARNADMRVIFISGMNDRKSRDEMLNAGAAAVFEKPIPLADFLNAVERSLGLASTIIPPAAQKEVEKKRESLAELLSGFRQAIEADALFMMNDRGQVLARAGNLYDSSMEVSLFANLTAIFSAGMKVSRFVHQTQAESFHVFRGGDHDLILIPVDSIHALLLAGKGLARAENLIKTVEGMLFVREDVALKLKELGVAAPEPVVGESAVPMKEAGASSPSASAASPAQQAQPEPEPEVDLDALFASAKKKTPVANVDDFWNTAVEAAGNLPVNADVLTFEQARKLGLTPGSSQTIPIPPSLPQKKK